MHTHLNYLVIVSPPFIPTAGAASATVRNFVARTANSGDADITKVTVFDPENKLVAYSGAFPQGVREIISAWSKIYVLTNDGKVSQTTWFFRFLWDGLLTSSFIAFVSAGEVNVGETGYALSQISIPPCAEFGQDAGIGSL